MSHKIFYSLGGLFLGILVGALLGLGESNYTKKSLRPKTIPILTIVGATIGGGIGIFYGYKIGVKHHIEETTGISSSKTIFQKEGRYWLGETFWSDSRDKDLMNVLETKRIGKGLIVTFLNSNQIYLHSTDSASKESITKCHKLAKQVVFNKIIETFDEQSPQDFGHLFKS